MEIVKKISQPMREENERHIPELNLMLRVHCLQYAEKQPDSVSLHWKTQSETHTQGGFQCFWADFLIDIIFIMF